MANLPSAVLQDDDLSGKGAHPFPCGCSESISRYLSAHSIGVICVALCKRPHH